MPKSAGRGVVEGPQTARGRDRDRESPAGRLFHSHRASHRPSHLRSHHRSHRPASSNRRFPSAGLRAPADKQNGLTERLTRLCV